MWSRRCTRYLVRGAETLERTLILGTHKRNLKLAPLVVIQSELTGREENVSIVRSKHIAAE
jgi:hypothetical protein